MFLSSSISHTTVRAVLKHTSECVTSSLVTLPWLCIVFRRNASPSYRFLQWSWFTSQSFAPCPLPSFHLQHPVVPTLHSDLFQPLGLSLCCSLCLLCSFSPSLSPSYYFGIHCSVAPNTGHGNQEIFPNFFISRCLQSFNVFLTGPLGQKKSLTVL